MQHKRGRWVAAADSPATAVSPAGTFDDEERTIFRRIHRDERGVAAAELAFVLPVLLIVLLGIVEFGRALVYWNDTTQIASVGARWAVVNRWPCTGAAGCTLQDAIEREVAVQQGWNALADGLTACVDFIDADGDGDAREVGDAVRVRTSFTFDWQFMPSWIEMADTTIRSSATMRLENVPTYAAGC